MTFFRYSMALWLLWLPAPLYAADECACPLTKASYKPHISYKNPLHIMMTIEKPPSSPPHLLYKFTAHDEEGTPLSTLQLGEMCSNGIAICRLSSFEGQINDVDHWVDFEAIRLDFLALNKDFSPYRGNYDTSAPYAYIFPNTITNFYYEEKPIPKNAALYTKFFTEEKVYPDFGGLDVWIFSSCQK